MKLASYLAPAAMTLLLAACAPQPVATTGTPPEPALPPVWQAESSAAFAADGWLQRLADPELRALVAEALTTNPGLARLRARLSGAQAALEGQRGAAQPDLDLSAGAARTRSLAGISNSFDAAVTLGWEIDLWKRLAAAERAAFADREAALEALRAGELSLAANVAKGWFAASEARAQLELSRSLVENLRSQLEVLEENYRLGLAGALDIHLARANLATEESRLSQRQQLLGERKRALETLLGRYPASRLEAAGGLPDVGPLPAAGIPADLLLRRPDLRASLARMEASASRAEARYRDRFPRFSLSGRYGGSSSELADLLADPARVWNLALNLTAPLFDAGRLKSLEAQAVAALEEARADHAETLLTALREVENALAAERRLQEQRRQLEIADLEAKQAEALAQEQYAAGLVDIITVLESQRRAFSARSSLLAVQLAQLENRINLYLALGGDFRAPAPQPE